MTTLADLGSRFKAARQQRGLTIYSLAEQSHINRNRLALFERGEANIELNTLLALCGELGLELVLMPKEIHGHSSVPQEDRRLTAMQQRVARRLQGASTAQSPPRKPDRENE